VRDCRNRHRFFECCPPIPIGGFFLPAEQGSREKRGADAKDRRFVQADEAAGGSDLYISSGAPPILRLHDELQRLNYPPLTSEQVRGLLFEILSEKQRAEFEQTRDLDFAYQLADVARFRGNIFDSHCGIGGVFRTIPSRIQTADGKGRVPALEILIGNPAVSNLIREGKTFQIPSIMQTARGEGMQTSWNCSRPGRSMPKGRIAAPPTSGPSNPFFPNRIQALENGYHCSLGTAA
jgi:hypothetical protein